MAYEKKDGDCVLFENTRRTADNQPIFRGTIVVDGKDHELTFWKKTSKAGNTFFSGNVGKPVEAKPQSSGGWGSTSHKNTHQPAPQPPVRDALDDELPPW